MKTINNILGRLLVPVWEHLSFFAIAYFLMVLPLLALAVQYLDFKLIYYVMLNATKEGSGAAAWGINYKLTPSCPIVYAYVLCCILYLFRRYTTAVKVLKGVLCAVLGMLAVTDMFLSYYFSVGISPQTVGLLLQTNAGESAEFFTTYILSWFSLFLLLGVLLFAWLVNRGCDALKRRRSKWKGGAWQLARRSVAIAALLAVGYVSAPGIYNLGKCVVYGPDKDKLFKYPYDVLSKTVHSSTQFSVNSREMERLINNLLTSAEGCGSSHRSPKIVWILGESFNKYHSNLYGYYLNTNPRLTQRQVDGELFVFNDVVTPYNNTSMCVKYLLSTESALANTSWCDKPLFPKLLRDAGYKVLWMDNQMVHVDMETLVWNQFQSYLNHPEVEKAIYDVRNVQLHSYDEELLTEWEECSRLQSDYNFIVFHLMGQHVTPDKRYPLTPGNCYFTADSIKRPDLADSQKQYIAHYANATRYNDMVVDSIISYFQEDDAIVVYMSDHGDEVYDYRAHAGRSYESPLTKGQVKYQFEVPMMIWCSDLYREKHPDVVSLINDALDRPFTVDDICHLFFDLAGMNTPYFDETRSVISPRFEKRKRMLVQEEYYEDIQ